MLYVTTTMAVWRHCTAMNNVHMTSLCMLIMCDDYSTDLFFAFELLNAGSASARLLLKSLKVGRCQEL